jgi:hypothetical protein
MEYAARAPRLPSRRAMMAPVAALVVGAGLATGAAFLVDDGGGTATSSKVIVVESPAPGSAQIPGKNEASTAAAIAQPSGVTAISGTDEAATAAAISSEAGGIQARGSKASATGTQDAATAARTDPHGPAAVLHRGQ